MKLMGYQYIKKIVLIEVTLCSKVKVRQSVNLSFFLSLANVSFFQEQEIHTWSYLKLLQLVEQKVTTSKRNLLLVTQ